MYNDQQPNPSSWQEEEQRMTPPPIPVKSANTMTPKISNSYFTALKAPVIEKKKVPIKSREKITVE